MNNEELQSRREFFKKAAKGALPILGAIMLANAPNIVRAIESKKPMGCNYACEGGCLENCAVGCKEGCLGSCKGTCHGSCANGCYRTCQAACYNTCRTNCTTLAGMGYYIN